LRGLAPSPCGAQSAARAQGQNSTRRLIRPESVGAVDGERSANRSQRRRDLRLRAGGSRTTNHGFAQARYCLASRAHHAFFLTARFPGDGQEARNWRAFAAAFRSPRTAFLARMRFGRFVSGRRNPVSPMQIDLGQLAGFDVSPRSTDKAQCSLSPGSPTRARGC